MIVRRLGIKTCSEASILGTLVMVLYVCVGGRSGCLLAPTARLTWLRGKSIVSAARWTKQLRETLCRQVQICWYVNKVFHTLLYTHQSKRCSRGPEGENYKQTATRVTDTKQDDVVEICLSCDISPTEIALHVHCDADLLPLLRDNQKPGQFSLGEERLIKRPTTYPNNLHNRKGHQTSCLSMVIACFDMRC